MVESQRRLGQELQEGVEAREDAEAARDQAQVLTSFTFAHLLFFWVLRRDASLGSCSGK